AWRLENLGFTQVHRYTAGKADWFAYGLPTEGTRAEVPRIGALARKDVPTCGLDDRIGEVRERVRAAGWDLCLVVNEHNIVLGLLRQAQLGSDPSLSAQRVMEEGPVTYRPNRLAEEVANYLAKRRVPSILVTTSDGELIGVFYRKDVEQA